MASKKPELKYDDMMKVIEKAFDEQALAPLAKELETLKVCFVAINRLPEIVVKKRVVEYLNSYFNDDSMSKTIKDILSSKHGWAMDGGSNG